MVATGLGGRFGQGLPARARSGVGASGLLKSLAKENVPLRARAVDLALDEEPQVLAEQLFCELLADDSYVEVGYAKGERYTLVARPSSSLSASAAPLELDADSVVVLLGGARGITALAACALARRFRCKIELVGRSELAEQAEEPALRDAKNAADVRRVLAGLAAERGERDPRAIDQQCRRILANREIRETLTACRTAGAQVNYHSMDVRDEAALATLIDQLRKRHGRIDVVIHGAGLIEDKLIGDKTAESFDRVYTTKVAPALVISRILAEHAQLCVFFSSTSGAFGNRGQTDYGAANDALDKLARQMDGTAKCRMLSINWGPWRGAGMVTAELAREYERRGIGLISAEAGIDSLLQEIEHGQEPQVVLTAAAPKALA